MAEVRKRKAIKDYTVTDSEGTSFTIKKDQEYTTSALIRNDEVMVFSRYWVRIPIDVFQEI